MRIITLLLLFYSITCACQDLLTLNMALEKAALYSPDLKQAALYLEKSQENLNAKKASLKSDFSLDLSPISYTNYLKYDDTPGGVGWYNVENTYSSGTFAISQPILLTDATLSLSNYFKWQDNNGDQSYYNNLTLQLDQPLFTHNEQKMALKEVELDVEDALLDYELEKLSLETSVTEDFYDIYEKQMQVLINEEELNNQRDNHRIIKQKVNLGLIASEELYQSEVNLITSETELETAQLSLLNAKDEFIVLLGLGFNYDFTVLVNVMMDSVPVNMGRAIDRAINVAQEIRQREIDIELAEYDLISTKDENGFQGNISLQVGLNGQDESVVNIYDKATNNTGIGLSLKVPIWDWGKRKSEARVAEISLQRQELYLEEDKTDITLSIRKLYRSLNSLLRQIEKAEKNVHNAQLTYDINAERYRNGDITSMDLQLLQNQLSEKKMAQTSAIIDYKLGLLSMKIQTLYDWEKNEELVPEELFEQ